MIFNTKSDTFSEIIAGDKKYLVPKFQRDYSWTETEWEDLLIDIDNLEGDESHYMGYLVFQSIKNTAELWVIDGQQRMTTLSLLLLAILSNLNELSEDPQNQERIRVLRQKYIGSPNPVSLNVQSKLVLNRNNNDHYKRLCSLDSIPKRKIKSSERKMTACLEFFKGKLKPKCPTGELLATYAENISRKLFFTTITVDDESNAYKVFETLNARGVKLSVPDLMKNYLFSLVDNDKSCSSSTIDDLDDQWAYIAEQLGKNDFDKFIRTDWNTKNPLVTKNNLFKRIKSKIDTATKAFEYIGTLTKCIEIYSALQDPKDEFWSNKDFENKNLSPLITLNIFNITQPQGVLLAAYQKFDIDGFIKVLGYIEVFSIRYNVICQNSPPEQEGFYNKLARKIFSQELTNHLDIKKELLQLCPNDQEFYEAFSRRKFKTSQTDKKVRHLLTHVTHGTCWLTKKH